MIKDMIDAVRQGDHLDSQIIGIDALVRRYENDIRDSQDFRDRLLNIYRHHFQGDGKLAAFMIRRLCDEIEAAVMEHF